MTRSLSFAALPLALAGLLAGCGTEQKATPVAAAAPAIHDGSLMTPGRPQLATLPAQARPGEVPVTWNMWWGENGRRWTLYVNGAKAGAGELHQETPKAQQATAAVTLDNPGTYELKVTLCNDHGCSESEPATVTVAAST